MAKKHEQSPKGKCDKSSVPSDKTKGPGRPDGGGIRAPLAEEPAGPPSEAQRTGPCKPDDPEDREIAQLLRRLGQTEINEICEEPIDPETRKRCTDIYYYAIGPVETIRQHDLHIKGILKRSKPDEDQVLKAIRDLPPEDIHDVKAELVNIFAGSPYEAVRAMASRKLQGEDDAA